MLLCGYVHGYEGYAASEVGFGVRVAAALGVQTLIVTNASGGIDPTLVPGDIVAIADQLNLTGTSVLCGPNDERLGPRFVDMTDAYSPAAGAGRRGRAGGAGLTAARGGLRRRRRPGLRNAGRGARWAPGWWVCQRCTK